MPDPLTGLAITGGVLGGAGSIIGAFNQPSAPSGKLELPPELEAGLLDRSRAQLERLQKEMDYYNRFIPQIEERVNFINQAQRTGMPQPDMISKLNQMDQKIALEFGERALKDVQSNIISQQVKDNVRSIGDALKQRLAQEGNPPDAKTAAMIDEAVRGQFASGSGFNQAFDQIQSQALQKMQEQASTEDPATNRLLQEQENQLRTRLRQQLGPGYEQTSAGQQALNDMYQRAAETKFAVSEQLKSAGAQRFGMYSQAAQNAALGRIQGQQGLASLGLQGQAMQQNILGRLSTAAQISSQMGEASANAEAAQRANAALALGASGQQQNMFNQSMQGLGQALAYSTLPSQLMRAQSGIGSEQMGIYSQLGQFDLSGKTKDALKQGVVPGYQGRSNLYGGYFGEQDNWKTKYTNLERQMRTRGGY